MEQGKTLGVMIDSELKFDDMISKVCQAGYFQLSQSGKLKSVLGKDEKLLLVNSLILSKMDFCSFLYAAAKNKQLKPLHKLLNAVVMFIFCLQKSTPFTRFMAECHILQFNFRIKNKLCYYLYKVIYIYISNPKYLSALFYKRVPLRTDLRSASKRTAMATDSSQGTIARHMCDKWSALPCEVRENEDFKKYKKKLKFFYFIKAFN